MDKKYKYSPFNLECEACSAPMEFDIIKQNYSCMHCGATAPIGSQKKRIEDWAENTKINLQNKQNTNLRNFECSNCGATVNSIDNSEIVTCSFCNTTLVQKELAQF